LNRPPPPKKFLGTPLTGGIIISTKGPHGHGLEFAARRRTKQEKFCALKILPPREIYDGALFVALLDPLDHHHHHLLLLLLLLLHLFITF
jgi:hypothetical protein